MPRKDSETSVVRTRPRLPADVGRRLRDLRGSLWFQPSVLAIAGAGLGVVLPVVELRFGSPSWLGEATTPEGATNLLSAGVTTLSALLAVGFSIATVTVQLAASSYTPRLLRRFISDPVTKQVLGVFTASLAYILVVLRSIRHAGPRAEEFVPYLSVAAGIAVMVACVALLPFFLHHVARSIQVSTIVTGIARDTSREMARLVLGGRFVEADRAAAPQVLPCRTPGYLRVFDAEAFLAALPQSCERARVEVAAGEFVLPGAPLVSIWPEGAIGAEAARDLEDAFSFSRRRDLDQDVLFGVRQLVDLALKAISPAVNDATTAIMALNELGVLLVAVIRGGAPATARWRVLRVGRPYVLARALSVDALVRAAFDDVMLAGRNDPRIVERVLEILAHTARIEGGDRAVAAVLDRAVRRVREIAAESAAPAAARRALHRRLAAGARIPAGANVQGDAPTQ